MSDSIYDAQFGDLIWDETSDWWTGRIDLYNYPRIELNISPPDEGDRIITDQARHSFRIITESENQIRQKACDELLEVHNQSWNESAPLTAEEFMRRMIPESVSLYADGGAEIYFADDDMFWGHVIIVSLSSEGEFSDAYIAG